MEISFKASSLERCADHLGRYLEGLAGPYDNYLENFVLRSDFYAIQDKEQRCLGYFALSDAHILTQFYLTGGELEPARPIFRQVLREFEVESALVPTTDAFLTALSLENHSRHETTALTYAHGGPTEQPAEYPAQALEPVDAQRLEEVHHITDNLFDGRAAAPDLLYQIYALRDGGEILGYGLREEMRLFPGHESLGVFTIPKHRQKGVARSLLLHMAAMVAATGRRTLSGCWVYNQKAKMMLDSAGFTSVARINKIYFSHPDLLRSLL